jgi:hypothetical protein
MNQEALGNGLKSKLLDLLRDIRTPEDELENKARVVEIEVIRRSLKITTAKFLAFDVLKILKLITSSVSFQQPLPTGNVIVD